MALYLRSRLSVGLLTPAVTLSPKIKTNISALSFFTSLICLLFLHVPVRFPGASGNLGVRYAKIATSTAMVIAENAAIFIEFFIIL